VDHLFVGEHLMNRKRRERRIFDASFKLEVVRMVKDQELSISDVCRSMDLGETASQLSLTRSAGLDIGFGSALCAAP
jgi:transposase